MPHIRIVTASSQTRQKDKKRRVSRQGAVIIRNPIECDGAVVRRAEALAAEPDVGDRPEEGGEDGLDVAVPSDERKRVVRPGEGLEGGQERASSSAGADDFERRVGWRLVFRHSNGGGVDVDGGGKGEGETRGLVLVVEKVEFGEW